MQQPAAQPAVETRWEQALLARAQAAAVDGRYTEAKRLLTQVWSLAAADTALADAAAWGIGWLLLHEREYRHAELWFGRVTQLPSAAHDMWPFVRHALVGHCQALATPLARERGATPRAQLAPLTIISLGRWQIMRGGVALPPLPVRKALAILRYLLTRPQQRAHKDELAELLWPQAGVQESAHSLHVAVAALRRYLDPPETSYLLFDAGDYRLAPDAAIFNDVQQFQQQIDQAESCAKHGNRACSMEALAGAVACYTGDYYVDDRDATWALAERERLLLHYLTALDHLGRMLADDRQHEQAAECFRLLLARDGYREDACANLMRCYLALGRRHDAVQQYELCRALLRNDLDLAPGEELETLYQRVYR